MNDNKRYAVIGAGLSGLTAAHRLKAMGKNVVLLEKARRPGGVILSEEVDGYLIERGPNSSQGSDELLDMIEELGIQDELVVGDPKAPAYVYHRGRLHLLPRGPGVLLTGSLLTWPGKLRLLLEPIKGRRRIKPGADEEESIYSFFARRLGRQVAEKVVSPFAAGIYAGDARRISVQAAFPGLAELEKQHGSLIRGGLKELRKAKAARESAAKATKTTDSTAPSGATAPRRRKPRLCSFRRGMAFLPERLAESLGSGILFDCSDLAIARAGEAGARYKLTFLKNGQPEEIVADRVVIAAPSWVAADFVRPLSAQLAAELEAIEYPPLSILYLSYPESAIRSPIGGFGFLVPPSENSPILGCVYSSSLFEGRAPEGMVLLTVFAGGAINPEITELDESELVHRVHGALQKAIRIVEEPQLIGLTRLTRSIPQYNIGHAARVARIESLIADLPGFELTGNYLHGVSTGDCIKQGNLTAHRIAGDFQEQTGPK